MEHLNRLCKDIVQHLGANKNPKAIARAGKALGGLQNVLHNFDTLTKTRVSTTHTAPSHADDLLKAVELLAKKTVFAHQPGRKQSLSFHFVQPADPLYRQAKVSYLDEKTTVNTYH